MKSVSVTLLHAALLLALMGGLSAPRPVEAGPMSVVVSILPQKYFLEQIGGDFVDVQVMVKPGASPATYEPKPGQMAVLGTASLYFSIGVPFEHVWLEKIIQSNPGLTVVPTDKGIIKRHMIGHDHLFETDSHANGKDSEKSGEHSEAAHDHIGLDPHIWLSPPLVKMQAATIRDALMASDPEHAAVYADNCSAFLVTVDALHRKLTQLFKDKQGAAFMVFHPSWGYFADAYGLNQIPVEIEGKEPKPSQLASLINHARKSGISAVFVQPQFSTKSARLIAREIRGQVVVADSLAEDWPRNLETVAGKFREALQP